MEFFRQEHWSRLPFPTPWDLRNPGIEPKSPALQADSLPSKPPGKSPFRASAIPACYPLCFMLKMYLEVGARVWARPWMSRVCAFLMKSLLPSAPFSFYTIGLCPLLLWISLGQGRSSQIWVCIRVAQKPTLARVTAPAEVVYSTGFAFWVLVYPSLLQGLTYDSSAVPMPWGSHAPAVTLSFTPLS